MEERVFSKSLPPSARVSVFSGAGNVVGVERRPWSRKDLGPGSVSSPAFTDGELPTFRVSVLPLYDGGNNTYLRQSVVGYRVVPTHTRCSKSSSHYHVGLSFPTCKRERPSLSQCNKAETLVLTCFLFLPLSLNCSVNLGRNLSLGFSFLICEMRKERVEHPFLLPNGLQVVLKFKIFTDIELPSSRIRNLRLIISCSPQHVLNLDSCLLTMVLAL